MSNYKENLISNIEKEKIKTKKAIGLFFDSSKSINDRLKAFDMCGTFIDENDISSAKTIIDNRTTNESSIRAAAIIGLATYSSTNTDFQDKLLGFLKNNDESDVVKHAILTVLQGNLFSSAIFNSKKPKYTDCLRNIIVSNNSSSLKKRTAEYLALDKDEFIQRKLIDGLENTQSKFVEPEVAIQLLSYDLHSDFYPTLRRIVENPPNQRAKKEALRNLSSDPSSVELLEKTLNDKTEDKEIRHLCAVGLESLEPQTLLKNIKSLITDKSEDKELKVALLNTLNYATDSIILDNDNNFQDELKDLEKKTKSKKFTQTYLKYKENKLNK